MVNNCFGLGLLLGLLSVDGRCSLILSCLLLECVMFDVWLCFVVLFVMVIVVEYSVCGFCL